MASAAHAEEDSGVLDGHAGRLAGVEEHQVTGTWGEPEATRIVAGLRIAGNLTDPARWPTSPLTA